MTNLHFSFLSWLTSPVLELPALSRWKDDCYIRLLLHMVCYCTRQMLGVSGSWRLERGSPSMLKDFGLAVRSSSFAIAWKAPHRLGLVMDKGLPARLCGWQCIAAGPTAGYACSSSPPYNSLSFLHQACFLVRAAQHYPPLSMTWVTLSCTLHRPRCHTVSHPLWGTHSGVGLAHARYLLSSVESHTSHSRDGRSRFLSVCERPLGSLPQARLWV